MPKVGTGLATYPVSNDVGSIHTPVTHSCQGHGEIMSKDIQVIQDWTDSEVPLKYGEERNVRYKVFKSGTRLYQEIRDLDDSPIHVLELPQGMALERSSYEVLLRYVLVDVVNS
jgi:hypothetical protein